MINLQFFFIIEFLWLFLDSEEADNLEELKKTTAEEQAKLNKKRKKFKGQDSVIVEPMGKSLETEE